MPVYTLFGRQSVTGSAGDPEAYTLGTQFSASVSGALTAIGFYSPALAVVLPQTIALYAVTGTSLVHSESASWSGAPASGWVRAAFATPPLLSAATSYKAVVLQDTAALWYDGTASHYWDTGAGSGGITNGPLSAPNNAGASPGQASFNQGAALTYPGSSFHASNYWVDVEFTTPSSGLLMASFP